jgi:small subunit ribosomal protein S20
MRDSSVIALTVVAARSRFMAGTPDRAAGGRSAGWQEAAGARATSGAGAPPRHGRGLACPKRENDVLSPVFFPARQKLKGIRIMANTAQARKRARQAEATRARNASLKSALRTAVKKVRKAIVSGDKAAAAKQLTESQSVIDRIADKKVVHKNTASRTKSRLAQAIKAMA